MFKTTIAAIAAALLLPALAAAASITGASGSASSATSSSITVTWSLDAGESACGLYAGQSADPTSEMRLGVSPSSTAWSGGDGMAPGRTWRFVLRYGVGPDCINPAYTSIAAVDVPGYEAPPAAPTGPSGPTEPAPAPVDPAPAPTEPAPPTASCDLACQVAELTARVGALESAVSRLIGLLETWPNLDPGILSGLMAIG